MELIDLKQTPIEFRRDVVLQLGYEVEPDGIHLQKGGARALDPYAHVPLRLDNLAIVPGSVLLLDNNPASIASYFEDRGDIL